MVQNFSSFFFKRNHLCLNLRHQGGYHPCHHVTWEWGVVRLFEPFLLQPRREAFDFRFRKAHHRTFDGLTVAEACRGGGRERFGSQNVNSYVKIPKMFWVFHLFFFVFCWTELPSETIKFGWLSWCFLRFFFPHQTGNRICWPFVVFFAGFYLARKASGRVIFPLSSWLILSPLAKVLRRCCWRTENSSPASQ